MSSPFNAASWLVSRQVAAGGGERVAVRGTQSVTYAELDDLIGEVAAAYRCLGLRGDDRVMLVMSDDTPMLVAILGAFRAGLVAVPVSTMFTGPELAKVLADSGARALVCSHEHAESVAVAIQSAPELDHVILHGETDLPTSELIGKYSWDDFIATGVSARVSARQPADTEEDSWALWLYTSGTTGSPKAAMHRHVNIRHVCETYGDQVLGITPDDSTLSVAKMFFAYGIGNSVFFPLSVGATTVLEPRRPTPKVFLERLTTDRPTLFFGVPTFFAGLLASDLPDEAFSSVRLAASAGEPMPASLQARFTERFGVEIIDGIGSTEALHIFLSNRPGDVHPGTTGVPVPGYEVEVRDASGLHVEDGVPGSLHVRGESIALGYWRRAVASRQVFNGAWLNTGDTYVRSADGYYSCLGRSSDMLKAGGIWVSPSEVENRLLEHPLVVQAAVVGAPDSNGLDKPMAVVVVDSDASESDLISWCREGLAHFKAPRHVLFVDDLPKTATGKLQRFKVRELLAASSEAGVHSSSDQNTSGAAS